MSLAFWDGLLINLTFTMDFTPGVKISFLPLQLPLVRTKGFVGRGLLGFITHNVASFSPGIV